MFRRTTLTLTLVLLAGCNCQRAENIAAKERLSAPPPPSKVDARAKEKIDAEGLHKSEKARDRANLMRAEEIAARVGGYKLDTKANLAFARGSWKMNAKEEVHVEQAPEGDFSIRIETGSGGLQQLVYANDVLFLKNNNGKWRASRDPRGERTEYLNDSVGIWRSFYKLVGHSLVLEPVGPTTHDGRSAYEYTMRLPDLSSEAKELGKNDPEPSLTAPDGGPEDPAEVRKRVTERLKGWRKRARPAGGRGSMVVDAESGVVVRVEFKGKMVVGDRAKVAQLNVEVSHRMKEVGSAPKVLVPKEAIDEVARKKWPVDPYGELEEKKLLPPRPKEAEEGAKDGAKAPAKKEG
jgi:hypothetical protein